MLPRLWPLGAMLAGCSPPPAPAPAPVASAEPAPVASAGPVASSAPAPPAAPVASAPPHLAAPLGSGWSPAAAPSTPAPGADILPWVGLRTLPLGSPLKDFKSAFGSPAKRIQHNGYSIELQYRQGISAYVCVGDATERVFSITLRAPYPGKTREGLHVGSTIREVVLRNGPSPWLSALGGSTHHKQYPGGLTFHTPNPAPPKQTLDEEGDLDRPVTEISVHMQDSSGSNYGCGGG